MDIKRNRGKVEKRWRQSRGPSSKYLKESHCKGTLCQVFFMVHKKHNQLWYGLFMRKRLQTVVLHSVTEYNCAFSYYSLCVFSIFLHLALIIKWTERITFSFKVHMLVLQRHAGNTKWRNKGLCSRIVSIESLFPTILVLLFKNKIKIYNWIKNT